MPEAPTHQAAVSPRLWALAGIAKPMMQTGRPEAAAAAETWPSPSSSRTGYGVRMDRRCAQRGQGKYQMFVRVGVLVVPSIRQ